MQLSTDSGVMQENNGHHQEVQTPSNPRRTPVFSTTLVTALLDIGTISHISFLTHLFVYFGT